MNGELSETSRIVLQTAADVAREHCHEQVEPAHLLLALLEAGGDDVSRMLALLIPPGEDAGPTPVARLQAELEERLSPGSEIVTRGRLPRSPSTGQVLEWADEEARRLDAEWIEPAHLLIALARGERNPAADVLHSHGGRPQSLRAALQPVQRPPETIPLAPDEPRVNGDRDFIRSLLDDATFLDYRELPGDARLYVPRHEGWQAKVKRGWEQEFCYAKNPGEDYFHLLLSGEVFLQRGDEKLCLNCALRRGLLTTDRLYWQHAKRETPPAPPG